MGALRGISGRQGVLLLRHVFHAQCTEHMPGASCPAHDPARSLDVTMAGCEIFYVLTAPLCKALRADMDAVCITLTRTKYPRSDKAAGARENICTSHTSRAVSFSTTATTTPHTSPQYSRPFVSQSAAPCGRWVSTCRAGRSADVHGSTPGCRRLSGPSQRRRSMTPANPSRRALRARGVCA